MKIYMVSLLHRATMKKNYENYENVRTDNICGRRKVFITSMIKLHKGSVMKWLLSSNATGFLVLVLVLLPPRLL